MAEALLEQRGARRIKKVVFGTPWTNSEFAVDGTLENEAVLSFTPTSTIPDIQHPDITFSTDFRKIYAVGLCCAFAEHTHTYNAPAFMRYMISDPDLSGLSSGSGNIQEAKATVDGVSYEYNISNGVVSLAFAFNRQTDSENPYYGLVIFGAEIWGS